jgi:hypothetical protein
VTGSASVDRVPDPTLMPRTVTSALTLVQPGRFEGTSGAGGDLVAAVPFRASWTVLVDGRRVPQLTDDGLVRARDLPADAAVVLIGRERPTRLVGLWAQAILLALLVSLGTRPPRLAVRNARARAAASAEARAAEDDEVHV